MGNQSERCIANYFSQCEAGISELVVKKDSIITLLVEKVVVSDRGWMIRLASHIPRLSTYQTWI